MAFDPSNPGLQSWVCKHDLSLLILRGSLGTRQGQAKDGGSPGWMRGRAEGRTGAGWGPVGVA